MKSKFSENPLAFAFLVTWLSVWGVPVVQKSRSHGAKKACRLWGDENSPGPETSSGYSFVFELHSMIGHS